MTRTKKQPARTNGQRTIESQVIAERLHGLLKAHELNAAQLARELNHAHSQLYELLAGKRNVTPLLALKLARYFNEDPLSWMTLQAQVELAAALQEHGATVNKIVPLKDRT